MEITVNGKLQNFNAPLSVSSLLQRLGIDPRLVAVERNLRIVERTEIDQEPVEQGDDIEIIRMVAGG